MHRSGRPIGSSDPLLAREASEWAARIQHYLDDIETADDIQRLPDDDRSWFEAEFRGRNILDQAIGQNDTLEPFQQIIQVPSEGVFILTTDGIHDPLSTSQLHRICQERWQRPGDLSRALVQAAHLANLDTRNFRQKPDDRTALVVRARPRG